MCDDRRDTFILNFDSNRQTTSSTKPILESDHLMLPSKLKDKEDKQTNRPLIYYTKSFRLY